MQRTFDTLGKKKVIVGLVHLLPMPGTPFFEEGNFEKSLDKALNDAKALYEGGADGAIVQTVDRVYSTEDESDYARVAGVAAIMHAVCQAVPPEFQVGVQIMWNATKASMGVAKVAGGSFLRVGALIGATESPSGIIESNPLEVMNYRKRIGAENIKIIAEVDGMHFHWLGGGKSAAQVARMAKNVGASAVEVANPDEDVNEQKVREIKEALPDLPVILGGHTNHENAARRLKYADGAFVGSCFEKDGWGSSIDVERVRAYMDIVNSIS